MDMTDGPQEIDSLQGYLYQLELHEAMRQIDELRAENKRLRAALEWVRDDTELWDAPIVLEALGDAGAQG